MADTELMNFSKMSELEVLLKVGNQAIVAMSWFRWIMGFREPRMKRQSDQISILALNTYQNGPSTLLGAKGP